MSVISGLPPLPSCFSSLVGSDNIRESDIEKLQSMQTHLSDELETKEQSVAENGDVLTNGLENNTNKDVCNGDVDSDVSSFYHLNSALSKLRKEMVDLRQLDMSLLCQLWSLHESIQDYKTVLQDSYSEYSYGTGMSSRASSFSSLNDDSDWNEQDYIMADNDLTAYRPSMHSSTSSLLQQINELKQRVDSEF